VTPFRATATGASIAIRVQPRASRDEIAGLHGAELRVRITAPPVDGAANDALIRFLARTLGVSRPDVTVLAGHGSRSKVVSVRGITLEEAAHRLGVGG
jgi:uncharacterized protein (TIGR00251 family)